MRNGFQRKQLIILSLISVVMLAAIVLTFVRPSSSSTSPVKTTITKDPTSGQSFVAQQGVEPESQVNQANTPIFAGFDSLTSIGVSAEQVHALEQALQRYPDLDKKVQISLAVNSLQKNYPENSDPEYRWSVSSYIVANQQTTYRIKFYYSGTSSVQLYLYDASGKTQLFNSGVVTATN